MYIDPKVFIPYFLGDQVRVQSDPAGRLVITGQPEQLDNPWGITAFKKVSLVILLIYFNMNSRSTTIVILHHLCLSAGSLKTDDI